MGRAKREFAPEEETEIVAAYANGATVANLSRAYGTGWSQIATVLIAHGVYEGRKRQSRVQMEAEVCQRYISGESLAQLARAYQRSHVIILRILQEHGVERRPAGPPVPDYVPKILELRKQGLGARRIAKELSIGITTAQKWLRKAGMASPQGAAGVGADHQAWRGGTRIIEGYRAVRIPRDDPMYVMVWRNGYVMEHRLVMARTLGRPLERHETVHHKNGDTRDNRSENLQLRQGRHGKGARFVCLDCGSHNVAASDL